MSNQTNQRDNLIAKHQPTVVRGWWIFTFIVSLVILSSALLFLGGEAQAEELSEPAVETVKQQSEPVVEKADNTTQLVVDSAPEPVVEQIAEPVIEPVKQTAEPVKQASDPVEQAAQSVVETVQPAADPVAETVQPMVETGQPVTEPLQPVVEPVAETVQPVVAPVVDTVQPVVELVVETVQPVVDTLPIVGAASLMTEPVIDAQSVGDTMPAVQPVVDALTPPQVDPAVPGPTAAGTLEPANPPVSLSTSHLPVASSALDNDSVVVAGESSLVAQSAQSNFPVELSSFTYGSVEVLNSSYNNGVSHSLLGDLLTAADFAGASDTMNQTLQQQPLSPGVPPASGNSSSSSSSSAFSGGIDLLSFLVLFSLLLLGGKGLQSMREFTKPSLALIPTIERPG